VRKNRSVGDKNRSGSFPIYRYTNLHMITKNWR